MTPEESLKGKKHDCDDAVSEFHTLVRFVSAYGNVLMNLPACCGMKPSLPLCLFVSPPLPPLMHAHGVLIRHYPAVIMVISGDLSGSSATAVCHFHKRSTSLSEGREDFRANTQACWRIFTVPIVLPAGLNCTRRAVRDYVSLFISRQSLY